MKITVFGAGSWGSAFGIHLSKIGHDVWIYGRDNKKIQEIERIRENKQYLPGIDIPEHVHFTSDLQKAVKGAQLYVLAVGAQATRIFLEEHERYFDIQVPFVNLSKGLEKESGKRISQIVREVNPSFSYTTLSGPSHAEEVVQEQPTTLVIASEQMEHAKTLQALLSGPRLRVYRSQDVVGVELGGALKNIIAIIIGLAHGLGFGDNTKAAIMTRGMAEMIRIGVACGANESTFLGLSGMGDLIVTCTSKHSRNRRFGLALSEGKSVEEAQKSIGMLVEGYYTLASARSMAKQLQVRTPLMDALNDVLEKKEGNLIEHVYELMTRTYKEE